MSEEVKNALARVRIPTVNDRLTEAFDYLTGLKGAHLRVERRTWRGPGDGEYHAALTLDGGHVGVDGETARDALLNLYEAAKRIAGR